jgi:prevent-host-death family protein
VLAFLICEESHISGPLETWNFCRGPRLRFPNLCIIRYSDFMKKTSISVTEAARNFADCVNRVRYQNMTFVLLKNGAPVARLMPTEEKTCTGRELAAALQEVELSPENAKAWRNDLRRARKMLKPPVDRWQ